MLSKKAELYSVKINRVINEVSRIIVGQREVLRKLILALIADGHVLVEGVPGLAKTLMIKTLASTLNADFSRIQFTPDLLPADIVGTKVLNISSGKFYTKKGPTFTNLLLADEINRAPPKVQSALLEAMQERQVTIIDETFNLPSPFLVMATQNPIEHEGVYSLPEAQVDRFMFKLLIGYPSIDEEETILNRMTEAIEIKTTRMMDKKSIIDIQHFVRRIYADETIKRYVASIVDMTRHTSDLGLDNIVEFGASPRASIWLVMGAKANALLNGRGFVTPEDVKEVVHDVLRHRLILSYEGEAEGYTPDKVIELVIDNVKAP